MSAVTVTILSESKVMDPVYEVLSIDVVKEVNRIPYAQIILLDGDAAKQQFAISDEPFFEPGKKIEIKLRYEDGKEKDVTVFKGLVVRHAVEANDQGSLLTVEMKDTAIELTRTRKSEVYLNKTDSKIIETIISKSSLKKGVLAATKAEHAESVQYYCTDWDFIRSRADANGLLVVANDGEISLSEIKFNGKPKHTFEFGISNIFNFDIEVDASHQYAEIQSVTWDVKTHKLTKASKAQDFNLQQGNLKAAKVAEAVGSKLQSLTDAVPQDPKAQQAWADSNLINSRMTMLRGRLSVPGFADIQCLDLMEVSGVGKRFNGKNLITGLRHRVDESGWLTDVQFGLGAETFASNADVMDTPAAGQLPGVNGLQIGVVSAFKEDPDKEFRVSINLPGLGESAEPVWARLASPDAGKERGYFFRPETGDEVIVGFFNDDPRQAVILGAMFGSKNAPPKDLASINEKNICKAIVSKTGTTIGFIDDAKSSLFIETPSKAKILLDDDTETILLADQNGNTLTMNKDGITIKSSKDLMFEASGNVEIKGSKVDVK